jgi:hypothetical protein
MALKAWVLEEEIDLKDATPAANPKDERSVVVAMPCLLALALD